MTSIRKRRLDNAVWIPLRASHQFEATGEYGKLGYSEEFFGVGSLAVPLDAKSVAESLGWSDVGIAREHSASVENGVYTPSDAIPLADDVIGVPLVLEQRGNGETPNEWHLHQDLVIGLGLVREGDKWLALNEGYREVARLTRKTVGQPSLLEISAEYLKDYLCARDMALYVVSYRSRRQVTADSSHILWKEDLHREEDGPTRWEGRRVEIHEGGAPFGTSTAVLHLARTDVDASEDFPTLQSPMDGNVASQFWRIVDPGRKLSSISGEYWRCEWVEPGGLSVRVRGDVPTPSVFFAVDILGNREAAGSLKGGGRWLWFRPEVIDQLSGRRGGTLRFYTLNTGGVGASPHGVVHFGVNKLGLVNVYAKDVAFLPEWEQRIWAGFSVGPDGGVSEELLLAQVRAVPASTRAPEVLLPTVLDALDVTSEAVLGFRLLRPHKDCGALVNRIHRFRSIDLATLLSLSKDVTRLITERINERALRKKLMLRDGEKLRSLSLLERVVAQRVGASRAHAMLGPLNGIYALRLADAHLSSRDHGDAVRLAAIDRRLPYVIQGRMLIGSTVASLAGITRALRQPSKV